MDSNLENKVKQLEEEIEQLKLITTYFFNYIKPFWKSEMGEIPENASLKEISDGLSGTIIVYEGEHKEYQEKTKILETQLNNFVSQEKETDYVELDWEIKDIKEMVYNKRYVSVDDYWEIKYSKEELSDFRTIKKVFRQLLSK
jgi:hypothetical protein